MKYIKTFENIGRNGEIYSMPQLKKYMVAAVGKRYQLVVLKILEIKKFETRFERIYVYYCDPEILHKSDGQLYCFTNDKIKEMLLYTSDNLDETLEMLPALNIANKYNL